MIQTHIDKHGVRLIYDDSKIPRGWKRAMMLLGLLFDEVATELTTGVAVLGLGLAVAILFSLNWNSPDSKELSKLLSSPTNFSATHAHILVSQHGTPQLHDAR